MRIGYCFPVDYHSSCRILLAALRYVPLNWMSDSAFNWASWPVAQATQSQS